MPRPKKQRRTPNESRDAARERRRGWPRIAIRISPEMHDLLALYARHRRRAPGDVVDELVREHVKPRFYVVEISLRAVGAEPADCADSPAAGGDADAA